MKTAARNLRSAAVEWRVDHDTICRNEQSSSVSATLEIFVSDEDVSFRYLILVIICHVAHLAVHHCAHAHTHMHTNHAPSEKA